LSVLTKVLALMVSLLAIFLCGVVVVFVTNTEHWKGAYKDQEALTKAAQVHAVATEEAMRAQKARDAQQIERQKYTIELLEQQNGDVMRQWTSEAQGRAAADGRATSAVALSESLGLTLEQIRVTHNYVQEKLEAEHLGRLRWEAQQVELRQELDRERAKVAQLESTRRRAEEKIRELENENTQIRQKLAKVTLGPSEVRAEGDRVTAVSPGQRRVPIRGEIVDVTESLAAISVGSSSGVRENMEFNIIRGGKFVGNLLVTHVEPTESAGQLKRMQGVVVKGDRVSTGFE
jgi:hypothetical protein